MSIYKIPSKLILDDVKCIIREINPSAVKHILVLSSPTVGKHAAVTELLNELLTQYKVTVFDQIKPDAPIDDLEKLIAGTEKPDLIIAIGGGSVVDSGKAISVGWQDAALTELFYAKKTMPASKIPVYAVPTTAGTGAELSYGAILYDKSGGVKGGIRGELLQPDKVVLDIQLYASAPAKLIAEVGFDCLTHAVETYISTASSPLTRYQSIAAINTVFNNLRAASINKNQAALEKMAIAAAMMGVNLALSTTCLPHRIQYAVGPATHTSHAQGLIVLYRGWLKEVSGTEKFKMLAAELNLEPQELTDVIVKLKKDLDIDYTLTSFGLTEQDLPNIAKNVTGNMTNDPCYQSIETIINILRNSL